MIELSITEDLGVQWINVKGRIDGMTSPEIERQIHSLIQDGQRTLVANLEQVNYISSAGLRVFLVAQKQLKGVGGEIILFRISGNIFDVFKMSGFDGLFQIVSNKKELKSSVHEAGPDAAVISREIEGVAFRYTETDVPPGDLVEIGSRNNLLFSQYSENDVKSIKATDFRFGTGLASIGNNYEEYKHLFGETIILNKSLFFYPAVKHPAVDFMLGHEDDTGPEYRFLHGFGFNGTYRYILLFDSTDRFMELDRLVKALFQISDSKILGIVILAESKGVWGMNLKRTPIIENQPENGKDIFAPENFSDWMNFPVEPSDTNNIVAAAGIAIREKDAAGPSLARLPAEGSNSHFHAGIFSKGPLSRKIEHFEDELGRVITKLEAFKVQHITGQTRFQSGMIGIIELKG